MTKRVLITGVSSGIGLAQARLFLENGYAVYGIDKSVKPDLSAENFHFLQLDVTEDLAVLIDFAPEVDVICVTAGILDDYSPLLAISEEAFEQVFSVNFFATVRLIRQYLPQMLARRQGTIITMCSIASFLAGGGGSAYTASKHALAGFTKQLALDYADKGIQVFGIAPGAVKTRMTQADFEEGGLADWVADQTPIKRWLDPAEIADMTLYLASGKATSLQGQIITMDGGWSLK